MLFIRANIFIFESDAVAVFSLFFFLDIGTRWNMYFGMCSRISNVGRDNCSSNALEGDLPPLFPFVVPRILLFCWDVERKREKEGGGGERDRKPPGNTSDVRLALICLVFLRHPSPSERKGEDLGTFACVPNVAIRYIEKKSMLYKLSASFSLSFSPSLSLSLRREKSWWCAHAYWQGSICDSRYQSRRGRNLSFFSL